MKSYFFGQNWQGPNRVWWKFYIPSVGLMALVSDPWTWDLPDGHRGPVMALLPDAPCLSCSVPWLCGDSRQHAGGTTARGSLTQAAWG